jgi:hypothetical protein
MSNLYSLTAATATALMLFKLFFNGSLNRSKFDGLAPEQQQANTDDNNHSHSGSHMNGIAMMIAGDMNGRDSDDETIMPDSNELASNRADLSDFDTVRPSESHVTYV